MSKARDVKLKITQRFTDKADKENIKRAVITDALGNMSGAGSVWYDQNDRRVWHMVHGATNPAPIRCTRLPNPYIGLKVLIGKTEGVFEYEVLSDDPYDRPTNATGSNWTAALSTVDLSPGGRALLWLQTRALVPLAVWPGTGLSVNINAGDYQYAGAWVKYFGSTNYDLSASVPGAGLHRFIGIYLDSTGALQTVDGATAALALTPPDPVFPADVFRLAMVRLNDTQTVFSFANDIYDWRPIWSDPQGGGSGDVVGPAGAVSDHIAVYDGITGKLIKDGGNSIADLNTATQTHAAANKPVPAIGDEIPLADSAAGWVLKTLTWDSVKSTLKVYFDTLYANWPLDKVITVSSTNASADYATLALALAGLPGAGYTILLDAETFTETVIITTSCTIIGLNRWLTKINGATNNKATIETQADVNFYNLTITNTGDGGGSWPLGAGKQNAIIINNDPPAGGDHFVNFLDCIVSVTTHNIDGSMAVGITGNAGTGLIRFINTDLTAVNTDAASTTDYGIYHDVGTLQIEGGKITGQDYDVYRSGGTVTLKAPTLQNSLIFGTYTGFWFTSTGSISNALGSIVNEFSIDGTMGGNSDAALPTEKAVKTYVTTMDVARVSKLIANDGAPDPALSADASGYLSAAVQPLLVAYKSAQTNDVTGEGTVYTVIMDTEITDRDSNYNNATGTFTAPVAGNYFFGVGITFLGVLAAHTDARLYVTTTDQTIVANFCNSAAVNSGGYVTLSGSGATKLDNGDTLKFQLYVGGGVTKVIDVYGAAAAWTYGAIYLLP